MSQELWPSLSTERKRLLRGIWNKGNILATVLLLMMNLLSRKLRRMWTDSPFSTFFPPCHAFFRLPTLLKQFQDGLLCSGMIPLLKKIEEILIHFLGSTLASLVKNHHSSGSFAVRRCWKMDDMKDLAACMKFFRKHKSVPSVHCEKLNPFHYSKKGDFLVGKEQICCITTLPPAPLLRNWFCCSLEEDEACLFFH